MLFVTEVIFLKWLFVTLSLRAKISQAVHDSQAVENYAK